MNADKLKLWIDELETTDKKQGTNYLHRKNGDGVSEYCCLGILCEVAVKDGLELAQHTNTEFGRDVVYYDAEQFLLPGAVMEWLGVIDNSVSVKLGISECNVTYLNDSLELSFKGIAQKLRETYDLPKKTV